MRASDKKKLMRMLMGGFNSVSGSISCLLRDDFTFDLTAGNVDGTLPDIGPARVVVGDVAVTGGEATFPGTGGGFGNEYLAYNGISRADNLYFDIDITSDNNAQCWVGFNTDSTPGNFTDAQAEFALVFNSDGNIDIYEAGSAISADVAAYADATTYRVRFVLQPDNGCLYLISGGAFGTLGESWTALGESIVGDTATLYPCISNNDAVISADNVEVIPGSHQDFADYVTDIPLAQAQGLRALYRSSAGDNWDDNTGWLTDPVVGNWYGVTVSGGAVTQLRLDNNSLSGAIPTEIGNLTSLTDLRLHVNSLSGAIPTEIGNLTSLTLLRLQSNSLSGAIPTEIGNLTSLTLLYLQSNSLSGAIPTEIGNLTSLTQLRLDNNSLSGAIPGNLTSLTLLRLDNNSLSGIGTNALDLDAIEDLQLQDNSFNQTAIDAIFEDLYTAFPSRTGINGTINVSGNTAPSGTYQAQCPPTTGKEYAYELLNDSCGVASNHWATITFDA